MKQLNKQQLIKACNRALALANKLTRRIFKMKKIINNKKYDTNTATKVADYWNGYGASDFNYMAEELYVKKNGEYFLAGKGGPLTKYVNYYGGNRTYGEEIIPMTLKEAKEWALEKLNCDEYEALFGGVEE